MICSKTSPSSHNRTFPANSLSERFAQFPSRLETLLVIDAADLTAVVVFNSQIRRGGESQNHPLASSRDARRGIEWGVRISIIVPAFNEEKLLAGSLAAIDRSRRVFASHGWESEVIVCDNNSRDRTGDIARQGGAAVVFEPVNGIARARNRGAAAATGDWLIFIDADSHPSPRLFEQTVREIEGGRCIGGGARIDFFHHLGGSGLVTAIWNTPSQLFPLASGSYIFF